MLTFESTTTPGSLAQALREAKALVRELESSETAQLIEKTPYAALGLCTYQPHNRYTSTVTFGEDGRLTISLFEHYEDPTETA